MVNGLGLFSGIAKIGGSILGIGGSKKASKQQVEMLGKGIGAIQGGLKQGLGYGAPYSDAGALAIDEIQELLGLQGVRGQNLALNDLARSPLYREMYDAGAELILQNEAATGGLRGGNIQRSLADFGSDTFAKLFQYQLGNLGGLGTLGANVAGNQANLISNANQSIANLFSQQGAAKAGGTMGQQGEISNFVNNAFKAAGAIF